MPKFSTQLGNNNVVRVCKSHFIEIVEPVTFPNENKWGFIIIAGPFLVNANIDTSGDRDVHYGRSDRIINKTMCVLYM